MIVTGIDLSMTVTGIFCSLYFVSHHTCVMVTTIYTYLAVKVGLNSGTPTENDYNSFTKNPAEQFTFGLEQNIKLPETSK